MHRHFTSTDLSRPFQYYYVPDVGFEAQLQQERLMFPIQL